MVTDLDRVTILHIIHGMKKNQPDKTKVRVAFDPEALRGKNETMGDFAVQIGVSSTSYTRLARGASQVRMSTLSGLLSTAEVEPEYLEKWFSNLTPQERQAYLLLMRSFRIEQT